VIYAAGMPDLRLVIVEGLGAGRQVPLAGPVDIGREPTAQLMLHDALVSRRHARVVPDEQGAVVEDLASTNGTFVDDVQIHAPTRLLAGHRILIGTTVLELRVAGQLTQPHAVPPPLARAAATPDYIPTDIVGAAGVPALQSLLDRRTKRRAALAPLAVFVLAALAVMVFLALR
jgi:hypothetical protein